MIIVNSKKGIFMVFNKKRYKILFIFFVLFNLFTIKSIDGNITEVYADADEGTYVTPADAESADPVDFKNALDTAPRGLDISDPTFLLGKFKDPGSDENINSSKVILRSPENPDDKTGILRVTHGFNQLGSIWSNIDKSNFLDVSQDQSMSMWLYFVRPLHPENPKEVGDGMAFVLQNAKPDSSALNPFGGIEAISRYNGKAAHGETLGVWGADFNNLQSKFELSKTAIQNSFAIEFDTFLNRLTAIDDINGRGVSFDADILAGRNPSGSFDYYQQIKGQHISMDYPDGYENNDLDPEFFDHNATYQRSDSWGNGGSKYFYKMNHKNLRDEVSLTDARWHHITVKFNHETSTLSYAFDDKDLNGIAQDTTIRGSQKLDMSHFKLGDSKKLRWGFTGSTGKFFENNLIVFESIPSFVNADSTVSLKDLTKGNTIPGNDDKVNVGDDLDFIYDLDYKNGSKEWNEISATMYLPSEVTFKDGIITYDDDPDHPEFISNSEFNNGKVNHLLLKSLSNDNRHAKIELHTTVNNQTQPVSVGEQHAHFASDNFIVDDNTPKFNITIPSMLLTTDPSGTVNYGSMDAVPDLVPIRGTVKYSNNQIIDPSKVTLHYIVNSNPANSFKLTGTQSNFASFNFDVLKSQLFIGPNTVKIYATDDSGQTTSQSVINIFIGGGLQFGKVSRDVSFNSVNVGYAGQLVPRKEPWQLEVTDGRSGESSWTLQAEADKMINEENKKLLDGDIVYKSLGGELMPLSELTSIYTNIKNSNSSQTVDVAKQLDSQTGIFLKLNGRNTSGKYSGKITWSLIDGIKNI